MIDQIIEDIDDLNINKYQLLENSDKLKVGWLSIYVPEEIIYAANMLPYHISGENGHNFPKASTHMHSNLCPYVLSSFEEVLDGIHNFSSGTIFVNACDARRRLYDVWKHFDSSKFLYLLDFSKVVNSHAKKYFRRQLENFVHAMEKHFHCKITEESLSQSIHFWNETRSMLNELYELRRAGKVSITSSQAIKIVKAGMTGLRDMFNRKLSRLLREIRGSSNTITEKKYKILLCGSFFDQVKIAEIVEDYGAEIACENVSMGIKYFEGEVDTTIDPLTALADYYLEKATCARMTDFKKRFDHILSLVQNYNIQSVIYFTLKFCDNNLLDFPLVKKKLNEKGVPVFLMESERTIENTEQIKTRIIAFLESQMG
jgi:benzoyl-CoA reductase/2-hydroxyglutaryl-CoA dehydratase subunit BcrC/BadD/HgdB